MAGRTIAIGDVHGDLAALERLLARLPLLLPEDTLLFVGDFLDRGPEPAGVVRRGASRSAWMRGPARGPTAAQNCGSTSPLPRRRSSRWT